MFNIADITKTLHRTIDTLFNTGNTNPTNQLTDETASQGYSDSRRIYTRREALKLLGLGGAAYAANVFSSEIAFAQAQPLRDKLNELVRGPHVGSVDALLKFQKDNPKSPVTEDMLVQLVGQYTLEDRKKAYAGEGNNFFSAPYMRDRADKQLGGNEFKAMRAAAIDAFRNHADPLYRENADGIIQLIEKSNLILVRQVQLEGQKGSAFEFYYQENGGTHLIPAPAEIKAQRGIQRLRYVTFDPSAKIVEPIRGILPSIEDQIIDHPLVRQYAEYAKQLFGNGKENEVVMTPQKFEDMRHLLRGGYKHSMFFDNSILEKDISEAQSIRKLLDDEKIKGRNRKALVQMRNMFEEFMEHYAAPQSARMAIERKDAYIGFTGPGNKYVDKFLYIRGPLSDLKRLMIDVSGKMIDVSGKIDKSEETYGSRNYRALIELMNFEKQPVSIPVTNGRIDTAMRDKVAYQYPIAGNEDLKLGAKVYEAHDKAWNYPGINSKTIESTLNPLNRDDIRSIWFIPRGTVNEVLVPFNPLYKNNSLSR